MDEMFAQGSVTEASSRDSTNPCHNGPAAAYAFYYWNQPDVPATNMTLCLAIAHVYADAELGFKACSDRTRTNSAGCRFRSRLRYFCARSNSD
jgi:hypothetical protein